MGGGGELAPPARTPTLFSYPSTGMTEANVRQPDLIQKSGNRQRRLYATRLNAGFLTCGTTQTISFIKPLLHVETFR